MRWPWSKVEGNPSGAVIGAGSFITCENGHLICEVVKPITIGMSRWTDCLGAWRIPEPMIGQPTEPCSCGARWIFGAPINRLFVKGRGWVPPLEGL